MPTINYIYHGNQYLCETDENDTPTKLYVNEPGTYTNLVSQKDLTTGKKSYPLYDALGSTRAVTDENGVVTDTFVYDAWGNVVDRTGATEIPFQYVGKYGYYLDEATDSNYVMERSYDPGTIRWLSVDPSGFIDGYNLYLYVLNRPLESIDPSGLAQQNALPCMNLLQALGDDDFQKRKAATIDFKKCLCKVDFRDRCKICNALKQNPPADIEIANRVKSSCEKPICDSIPFELTFCCPEGLDDLRIRIPPKEITDKIPTPKGLLSCGWYNAKFENYPEASDSLPEFLFLASLFPDCSPGAEMILTITFNEKRMRKEINGNDEVRVYISPQVSQKPTGECCPLKAPKP